MIGSIITIIFGLLVWLKVPVWITHGPIKVRQYVQLACNIIGILITISGVFSLIRFII